MTQPDFIFNLQPGDIGYDIETYPNAFTFRATHIGTGQKWVFEISFRRNDLSLLCLFLDVARAQACRFVGYNNIGFDYPVVHWIYQNRRAHFTVADIYNKAMAIINSHGPAKFAHMVWESDWLVIQIDLYKIHHFDNMSKATSLKVLEFNMRMESIEDLPFPPGTVLTWEQVDILIDYNDHDVDATIDFYHRSLDKIRLREQLTNTFNVSMMNCSDVKMGEKILIHQLQEQGVELYTTVDGRKQKRQTIRETIDLRSIIFPYIFFERVEFQNIYNYLAARVITETKGVFKDLIATVDGLDYKIGTGGLHASVESQTVCSTETHQLVDVDVAGFYVNLAIKNRLYPLHLGKGFCDAYSNVKLIRDTFDKGTPEDEAFKLAGNGAYGNSNNAYSPFLDAAYTMSVTINGQLMLCMLVEQLLKIPGLKMIQGNTDGLTYLCPREYLDHSREVGKWWESTTQLELEEQLYSRMFIRDVNSYIAEKENGKLKRIGVYAYETAEENPGTRELPHHKDWSHRVVAKAAEAALVHGTNIREFVTTHADVYDFFLRTKVPRKSTLEWGGEQVSNIVRYYVSNAGKPLEKVMPAAGPPGAFKRANGLTDAYYHEIMNELIEIETANYPTDGTAPSYAEMRTKIPHDERIHTKNKSTYEERRSGICTGWNVMLCNDLKPYRVSKLDIIDMTDINYEWYIKEAEKLVNPLRGV